MFSSSQSEQQSLLRGGAKEPGMFDDLLVFDRYYNGTSTGLKVFRTVAAILTFALLVWGFTTSTMSAPGKWFFKLTNWYALSLALYFIMSTIYSWTGRDDGKQVDNPSSGQRATSLFFELAWSWGIVVSIFFWAIEFQASTKDGASLYLNCLHHSLGVVLLFIDFGFNHITFHPSHLFLVMLLMIFNGMISGIYSYYATNVYLSAVQSGLSLMVFNGAIIGAIVLFILGRVIAWFKPKPFLDFNYLPVRHT